MKNRFCTAYLYAFLIFIIYTLFMGVTNILGVSISDYHAIMMQLQMDSTILTIMFIMGIAQTVVAAAKGLRRSARILGVWGIAVPYLMFGASASIIVRAFINESALLGEMARHLIDMGSREMGWSLLLLSIPNIGIFVWALKDLSRGHYLEKKEN